MDAELSRRVRSATARLRRDGMPGPARAVFSEALALAQVRRDLEVEGRCLLGLSMVHHHTGDFESAELCLARAAGVLRDVGLLRGGDLRVPEAPLLYAGRGALAAIGGRIEEAIGWFDRAGAEARMRPPVVAALVEATAAPWLAFLDPDRDLGDLDALVARLRDVGLGDEVAPVQRAQVTRLASLGEFDAAVALGRRVATTVGNPAELVRLLVPLAWAEHWSGDPERATATFERAAVLASTVEARFLRTMALFGVAESDPSRAVSVLEEAIEDAGSGPMWDQVWSSRPPVRIEVVGARRVLIGSREVTFRSDRAAELLLCVVLAGEAGLHWADLAALVWPGTLDPARAASSVSTHTAKARQELGAEGWRLRRRGPTLWFERSNVSLDLDELGPAALPDGVRILPGWDDRSWVHELERRRTGEVSRVR